MEEWQVATALGIGWRQHPTALPQPAFWFVNAVVIVLHVGEPGFSGCVLHRAIGIDAEPVMRTTIVQTELLRLGQIGIRQPGYAGDARRRIDKVRIPNQFSV